VLDWVALLEEQFMRGFIMASKQLKITAALAAVAIGLIPLSAAAADAALRLNATPLPRTAQSQIAQADGYGDSYYRPACPVRYYYACRSDALGNDHCACWPGLAYYIFRY
jgi:hypothetical protein